MKTIVLKFGGSSVSDNERLNLVAKKIIKLKKENNNIIVIVSAQGDTTNMLINEAKELSNTPNKRELDALLGIGEQISAAKLAILLNSLGYQAISLTGWQAGILTTNKYQCATIKDIDTTRIMQELENAKIVIITGFQGVNKLNDITTLGRGGSDTSAVAVAAATKADECYIFSDVAGIYTADPKRIQNAKKNKQISYDEMLEMSNEGAEVLHNRCIEIAEKFKIPIVAKSTFSEEDGTIINEKIEEFKITGLVKKDIIYVSTMVKNKIKEKPFELYFKLIKNEIVPIFYNNCLKNEEIDFVIQENSLELFQKIIELFLKDYDIKYYKASKISIIGNEVSNSGVIKKIVDVIKESDIKINFMSISENKINIFLNNQLSDVILNNVHSVLFNNKIDDYSK